jgi:hypothetical protein
MVVTLPCDAGYSTLLWAESFTLAYDEEYGVTLNPIWPAPAAGETHKELSAT